MKYYLKFLFALLTIMISFLNANSQINDTYSNEAIIQMILQAEQRGMSASELQTFLKSKGYSEAQINSLIIKARGMRGTVANESNLGNNTKAAIASNLSVSSDSMTLTNEEKKIFGFEVFVNKGISFTPNLNMATPLNYIIGPGDDLVVQIYGISQATINLKVSPEGKVVIPNVGVSHVGGLSVEAVKSLLTQKIGTRYAGLGGANPSSFLMVTLSNIRTIKVNIVGEVSIPGTYQLPSYTTIFNALYAAGGPSVKGSFRNIKLFRGGKEITEVDIYDFLLKGNTDKNIRLEDNDVLLVPQYEKRVEIVGEVRRNMVFEVKEKETVAHLIVMANGYTNNAYSKILTIQRSSGLDKSILNIDEREQANTLLFDGDYVIVGKAPNLYTNRIQIIGAVKREGDYEFRTNLRISDLITQAGGLKAEALRSHAILYRTEQNLQKIAIGIDLDKAITNDTSNNLILNKEDLLVVSSIYDIKENYFVTVNGEVNQAGTYPYSKEMTLSDLILLAKGFKEAASGSIVEIVRRVRNNNVELANVIKVEIDKDLTISSNKMNTTLAPFDQVFVRASIGFKELKNVHVHGEANYPGKYIIDRTNMTVGDLIKRAGGPLPSANIKGAVIIRRTIHFKSESHENEYLNKLLEVRSRYEDSTKSGFNESNKIQLSMLSKEIEKIYSTKLKNEETLYANGSLTTSSLEENKKLDTTDGTRFNKIKSEFKKRELSNIGELKFNLQSRVLKNLRNVAINDEQYQFVSIDLEKIIKEPDASKFDVQLQEGDILYIPPFNETVEISGDVLYPIVIKYKKGSSLKKYVNYAGGFNNTALRGRSYVVEPNGRVRRTHSFFGFKFYPKVLPGSQVFVPQKDKSSSNFSVDRVLGLVSSIVTTYLLIQNLTK